MSGICWCRYRGCWREQWCYSQWWGNRVWLADRTVQCCSVVSGWTKVRLCKPEMWSTAATAGIIRWLHYTAFELNLLVM